MARVFIYDDSTGARHMLGIGKYITTLSNNAAITARNTANTADIDLVKLNTSDSLELGGVGTALTLGADLILQDDGAIRTDDATSTVFVSAGSDHTTSTGGTLTLIGNDHGGSGNGGVVTLAAGNTANAGMHLTVPNSGTNIFINGGGSERWRFLGSASTLAYAQNGLIASLVETGGLTLSGGTSTAYSTGANLYLEGDDTGGTDSGGAVILSSGDNSTSLVNIDLNHASSKLQIRDSGDNIKLSVDMPQGIINFQGTMGSSSVDPSAHSGVDDWVEVKIAGTTHYLPAYLAT